MDDLREEIEQTHQLVSGLNCAQKASIQAAQCNALLMKIKNNEAELQTVEVNELVALLASGPWTSEQQERFLTVLTEKSTPKLKKPAYSPQHMLNFKRFISSSRHEKIKSPRMVIEEALNLAAQQLVSLECYTPSEKTYGCVVNYVLEAQSKLGQFDGRQTHQLVVKLKEYVDLHRGGNQGGPST